MLKGKRDDNLAQDDDYQDDGNDWNDAPMENFPSERDKQAARGRPKWKAIEEYWEQKRLKDALQDYPSEED